MRATLFDTQVTNPPIDPLREGLVMSLEMRLGKRGNLLTPGPDSYAQVPLLCSFFACDHTWSPALSTDSHALHVDRFAK